MEPAPLYEDRGSLSMTRFYSKGLQFECQKDCSKCCGGSPGYVWLNEQNIEDIRHTLGISREEFLLQYTKRVGDGISLIDLEDDNWNCIMLKDGKCSIYDVRPLQCRTYPFWHQNLEHKLSWAVEKESCPGIGKGRVYQPDEIEAIADGSETIDSVK